MPNQMMFPESCIVHLRSYDAECELCSAEIGAINQQQSDTNQETAKIVAQLEAPGDYQVDSMVRVAVGFSTLVDSLFLTNPKERAKFDAAVAVNLLREMVRQQAEVNRERLLS